MTSNRHANYSCVEPLNMVGKVQYIKTSEVSYNDTWVQKTVMCFIGLVLPLNASEDRRWKNTSARMSRWLGLILGSERSRSLNRQ